MICVHCGKEIDNGQDFCPYCGGRVGSDAAIRQDRGITFFFIMIFSFVFVLLTPPL